MKDNCIKARSVLVYTAKERIEEKRMNKQAKRMGKRINDNKEERSEQAE
jgi:hypothetical protein